MTEITDSRYLEFITRKDCPLCEAGMGVVLKAAAPLGVSVHTVDVDANRDLYGQFAERVPVVRGPGGRIIAEGRISLWKVRAALLGMTVRRRLLP